MLLDPGQCYRALRSHDARFDGRFFVGVATTRIYCRPVCRARTPRPDHCRFFPSAAAAEAHGFRPCLRCRPELAPGYAAVDANRRLAQAAAGLIEDGRLEDGRLPALACALGVTDRHLRRVFREEFGVAPVEYAQTHRLLLAKRLLADTDLAIVDVAMASGFSSLRRFNHLFRSRYRLAPAALRRAQRAGTGSQWLTFELAYRPPYDWTSMLGFLARRAIPGVEEVKANAYRRSVRIGQGGRAAEGVVEVRPAPGRAVLKVRLGVSLATVVPAALARIKHLFDLGCRPEEVAATLGPLAAGHPGLRVPGAVDGFETAVRAILGQQVALASGCAQLARFAQAFGEPLRQPTAGASRLFPSAAAIAPLDPAAVARLGIVAARARTVVALARAVASGELRLDPCAPVAETLERLQSLRGIGPWTAQYIAMRALAWPDAFPCPDSALLKALGERDASRALDRAEAWRPWRAYAAMHLWKSLERSP